MMMRVAHHVDQKRLRNNVPAIELGNGMEAFGESIEKSEAARLSFEQRRLDFQERLHKYILMVRANERAERREAEKRRVRGEMERMNSFIEITMQAILNVLNELTKKEQ